MSRRLAAVSGFTGTLLLTLLQHLAIGGLIVLWTVAACCLIWGANPDEVAGVAVQEFVAAVQIVVASLR